MDAAWHRCCTEWMTHDTDAAWHKCHTHPRAACHTEHPGTAHATPKSSACPMPLEVHTRVPSRNTHIPTQPGTCKPSSEHMPSPHPASRQGRVWNEAARHVREPRADPWLLWEGGMVQGKGKDWCREGEGTLQGKGNDVEKGEWGRERRNGAGNEGVVQGRGKEAGTAQVKGNGAGKGGTGQGKGNGTGKGGMVQEKGEWCREGGGLVQRR